MSPGEPRHTTDRDRSGPVGAAWLDHVPRPAPNGGSRRGETEWRERLMRQVLHEFATVVLLDDASYQRPTPALGGALTDTPVGPWDRLDRHRLDRGELDRDGLERYARDLLHEDPHRAGHDAGHEAGHEAGGDGGREAANGPVFDSTRGAADAAAPDPGQGRAPHVRHDRTPGPGVLPLTSPDTGSAPVARTSPAQADRFAWSVPRSAADHGFGRNSRWPTGPHSPR